MNRLRYMWVLVVLAGIPLLSHAQESVPEFYAESMQISNIGMGVLGGWALANITTGAWGWSQEQGQAKYFHQMNLLWNTVNLGIAGLAIYGNLGRDLSLYTHPELLDMQQKTQRILLINGALDVAYMGTGLLLRQLAPRYPKQELRLLGYGNSVILQGAFLFVFDLVLWGLHRRHRMDFLGNLAFNPSSDGLGLALSLNF